LGYNDLEYPFEILIEKIHAALGSK
jgi:hypothetical protein